jgi:hypothetical protein
VTPAVQIVVVVAAVEVVGAVAVAVEFVVAVALSLRGTALERELVL